MVPELSRRLAAEAVGTFLLVLFGAGAVAASLRLTDGAFTPAAVVAIGLGFAIGIAVAVYAFGDVSGAHINPSVTFALAVTRRFPWRDVLPYVAAQLVGAVVAAAAIVLIFPEAVDVASVGATTLGKGVSIVEGIVVEALGTALLLLAIMAIVVHERVAPGWAGLIIGLSVAGAVLVFLPLTGASLNAARTFGPYLLAELNGASAPWSQLLPVYVVGPFLGGTLAALVYQWIARPPREMEEPDPDLAA